MDSSDELFDDEGFEHTAAAAIVPVQPSHVPLPSPPAQPLQSLSQQNRDAPVDDDEQDVGRHRLTAGDFLLPQSRSIPGLQHILDNLLCDLHQHMPWWDDFHSMLKQVELLMNVKLRRDQLLARCVRGSAYAEHAATIQSWSARGLYEKRWHEVARFVHKALDLLPALRLVWNEAEYAKGKAGSEKDIGGAAKFVPSLLTVAMRSQRYSGKIYIHNIAQQHEII